ncbi:DUF1064 domain-containing protein [Priestia megaterium]|uniref:DUF1064 domain-containing protein n=1 Tax=Priestia megaterium TaxID=1404 RepID=UPI000CA09FD1|nr:DUF1064 domain-containing protein [Priestia megaterium]AUO14775.1 DUF1064 domain-containing protein [Priestia megaterium]
MGKRKINSTKMKYDNIIFDSALELSFYMHLLEHQKELGITKIEVHPSFLLIDSFTVDCLKCSGTGKKKSIKTGNDIKCSTCKGTGKKKREEMNYTADFMTHTEDGKVNVYDVKGWANDAFPLRKKVFESKYGIRLIEVYKKKGEWVYK